MRVAVPEDWVTVTSTISIECGPGVLHLMVVSFTYSRLVQGRESRVAVMSEEKLVPVMVTEAIPVVGPTLGMMERMVGAVKNWGSPWPWVGLVVFAVSIRLLSLKIRARLPEFSLPNTKKPRPATTTKTAIILRDEYSGLLRKFMR